MTSITRQTNALRAIAMRSPSAIASNRLATIQRHLSSSSSHSMAQASSSTGTGGGANGDEPLVKFAAEGSARVYTLNRPKKLNSLNHEMITLLSDKLRAWRESDLCNLIIGVGNERSFCAGGDVAELVKGVKEDKDTGISFFKDEFEMNWLMAHLDKPYVAVIDGITMGGGAGISLPAPIRIATSRTTFAMPETAIGYAPDVGVNYYLAQLDGFIGAWLAVTGQSIFGRTAYELGLATHYISPSSLPSIIRELTHHPDPTLSNLSALINSHSSPLSQGEGSKANPDGSSPLTPAVRQFLDGTFGQKSIKDIHNRLEGAASDEKLSEDVKKWAAAQLKIVQDRSPTGMAVALAGVHKAKASQRLDVVLKNDMAMATGFTAPSSDRTSSDFLTGVTHVLIDKVRGSRASWSPSEIDSSDVSSSSIEKRFFASSSSHSKLIPQLEFNPRPSPVPIEGPPSDKSWGKWRAAGLPSDRILSRVIRGQEKDSGAYALKEYQVVEKLMANEAVRKNGHATEEIERVVRSAVERKCEVDGDGYLRWKSFRDE